MAETKKTEPKRIHPYVDPPTCPGCGRSVSNMKQFSKMRSTAEYVASLQHTVLALRMSLLSLMKAGGGTLTIDALDPFPPGEMPEFDVDETTDGKITFTCSAFTSPAQQN